MKKILLSLLVCLLAGQSLFAQEPSYTWGEPASNDFSERTLDQLLVLDDLGFVLLRKYTDNTFTTHYWIEFYNQQMKFEGTNEVAFQGGVMGNSFSIDGIEVANGTIYAFVSHWNKEKGINTLNLNELSLDGQLTDLGQIGAIAAQKMGNRGMYQPIFSPDGNKLLLLSEMPFVKKAQEVIQLTCYQLDGLKELWKHDETLSYPSKRASNNEVTVDNQGRALLFKKFWEKPAWQYNLFTFSPTAGWKELGDQGLAGKQVEDFHMSLDAKGNVFCFGSYTNKPSAYNRDLHGMINIRFNGQMEVLEANVGNWPTNIVSHFGGDKLASNPDKSKLEDFYIKDVLSRNDGKELVLLEQRREDKQTIAGSSPMQFSYQWNYRAVLVLCIDPATGVMDWWQTFDKSQEVKNNIDLDNFGSFVYHLKEDRLFLLYNNTTLSGASIPPANWTEPDGTRYVKHKAFHDKTVHATFMHVIEPDGILAYENRKFGLPLFNLHEGAVFEMSLTTPFFFELNGVLVVMSSMHNGDKRYRFGTIGL